MPPNAPMKHHEVPNAAKSAGVGDRELARYMSIADMYDRFGVPRLAGLEFEPASVAAFVRHQVLAEYRLKNGEVTIRLWPLELGREKFQDDTIPVAITRFHQRGDLGRNIEIEYYPSAVRPECQMLTTAETVSAESLCITQKVAMTPSKAHVNILARYVLQQVGII